MKILLFHVLFIQHVMAAIGNTMEVSLSLFSLVIQCLRSHWEHNTNFSDLVFLPSLNLLGIFQFLIGFVRYFNWYVQHNKLPIN